MKTAGVFGCRFDAKQQPTAYGAATLDEKHDELVLVGVSNWLAAPAPPRRSSGGRSRRSTA